MVTEKGVIMYGTIFAYNFTMKLYCI